jgi:hypothetical protein
MLNQKKKKGPTEPSVPELEDEPLTIEKHLLDDIRGGLLPNPAPDRGPYPGSEIF